MNAAMAITVTPAMALAASEEAERLGVILPATTAGAIIEAALRVGHVWVGIDFATEDTAPSSPFQVLTKNVPGSVHTDYAGLLADLLEALGRVETLDDLAVWDAVNGTSLEMLADVAPVWGKQVDAAVAMKRAALEEG